MNKMKTLFITLLCMGAGTLSAQTADTNFSLDKRRICRTETDTGEPD